MTWPFRVDDLAFAVDPETRAAVVKDGRGPSGVALADCTAEVIPVCCGAIAGMPPGPCVVDRLTERRALFWLHHLEQFPRVNPDTSDDLAPTEKPQAKTQR